MKGMEATLGESGDKLCGIRRCGTAGGWYEVGGRDSSEGKWSGGGRCGGGGEKELGGGAGWGRGGEGAGERRITVGVSSRACRRGKAGVRCR